MCQIETLGTKDRQVKTAKSFTIRIDYILRQNDIEV